jgi:ribosomal protein S6--L-glutamate ligase
LRSGFGGAKNVRVLLIARFVSERGELDTVRIPEVAIKYGHSVDVLSTTQISDAAASGKVQRYDVVICRFSNEPRATAMSRALLRAGVPVVGGDNGVTVGDDQVFTLQALHRARIPAPESVIVEKPEEAVRAVKVLGCPVVTKDPLTMGGVGVRLARDAAAVRRHLSDLHGGSRLVVQRFYSESAGEDRRLFVVGSEVVGSVRRVARGGEFRANLFLGGTALPHRATATERDLAVAAAYAVGLDVAGVDILHTSAGHVVVEVNHNPGVTGIDLAAEAIVNYAERRSRLTSAPQVRNGL